MPRPPGFEPYSNFVLVHYQTWGFSKWIQSSQGIYFSHPRIALTPSIAAADALVQSLTADAGQPPGGIIVDSAYRDAVSRYFNRKTFAIEFFGSLLDSIAETR